MSTIRFFKLENTIKTMDATFSSPNEIDIKLAQHGEILYVLDGGKHNIPEKYELHGINGQSLCGSGILSVDDVEKFVINSSDSYPLTMNFRRQKSSEAKCRAQQNLKLPVAEDFFGDFPELTSDETEEYTKLAHSLVDSLLDAASATEGYNFICRKDDVDIYSGKIPGSKIHLIRGKSKIKTTRAEMIAMMIAPTTDSFRRLFHMIDGNFSDGLLLHKFPKNYTHQDMPFYSIKWGVFEAPGPISARDICWLEYGDVRKDEHGNEFGIGVASSVIRPECPELSHLHLIRADMMCSGYVFRQSEDPDYLDVTYVVQADPKGWLPVWAINMFAWQQGLNLARIRKTCEGILNAMKKMGNHHRKDATVQGVLISAGNFHNIPVTINEEHSVLSFGFCSESRNIDFHVQGLPDTSQWAGKQRYECHTTPVHGEVSNIKKGEYILHIDNTFSWFREKHIYYWFKITPQD